MQYVAQLKMERKLQEKKTRNKLPNWSTIRLSKSGKVSPHVSPPSHPIILEIMV